VGQPRFAVVQECATPQFGAAIALYLNVFVLIAQLFQKVPALKALAPTGKEPPFLVAQLCVMAIFIVLTIVAARKFHLEPMRTA
jgi:hypothetical protein